VYSVGYFAPKPQDMELAEAQSLTSVSATILNNQLSARLPNVLRLSEIEAISISVQFINTLPDATKAAVRVVFKDAYDFQLRINLMFSALALVSVALLWPTRHKRAKDVKDY
jgi:hypothetical protein